MRDLCRNNPFKGKIIDITAPISHFTPVFPGDPKPAIEILYSLENEGCVVSRIILGSHTGTHVDAPSHVLDRGLPIDKLELENLMGTAVVLDFSSLKGALTADVLEKALQNAGIFDKVSIILLKTVSSFRTQESGGGISSQNEGFRDEAWGNEVLEKEILEEEILEKEVGKEVYGNDGLDPVYLDESAAFWIVEKKFKTVGIDSFSVDNLNSETLPAHHILLSANVNIVECLELSSVDSGVYFFLCLPLKIEGCDGAPARALLISESGL